MARPPAHPGYADVEHHTGGRFSAEPAAVFARWDEFVADAAEWIPRVTTWDAVDQQRLGPPSPKPSQIFAVGVNYAAHSDETGIDVPAQPMIFTKFASQPHRPGGDLALADRRPWTGKSNW